MSLERELADCRERIVDLEIDKAYALKELTARGKEIERLGVAMRELEKEAGEALEEALGAEESATAEIERLRAALREIAGLEVDPTYAYQVETIAREALGDE